MLRYSQSRTAGSGLPSQPGQSVGVRQSGAIDTEGPSPEGSEYVPWGHTKSHQDCCCILTAAGLRLPLISDYFICYRHNLIRESHGVPSALSNAFTTTIMFSLSLLTTFLSQVPRLSHLVLNQHPVLTEGGAVSLSLLPSPPLAVILGAGKCFELRSLAS